MDTLVLPIFPLQVVLFPGLPLPLHIFEDRYREMIQSCLDSSQVFGVSYFRNRHIHSVGCTARIAKVIETYSDGRMDIMTRGERRFAVVQVIDEKSYLQAEIRYFQEKSAESADANLRTEANQLLDRLIRLGADAGVPEEQVAKADLDQLSFYIASCGMFSLDEKQQFLEIDDAAERLQKIFLFEDELIKRMTVNRKLNQMIHTNGHMRK